MEYNNLQYQLAEGVATITLNRPDVYNALNDEITYELQDVFKAIRKDSNVRVVVLTGAGKAFCSGQDLKASNKAEDRSFKESLHKRYNPLITLMRELPKPIIGKVNGVAAGAGASLALACDVVVMAEETFLVEVFINIGLVPDSGSSFFLPRLVGSVKAFELATMGSRVYGAEAKALGLVNESVPLDDLDKAIEKYLEYYSNAPTKAIGLIKKMLNKSTTSSLNEMLEYEAHMQEIAGSTSDHKEGVAAFLEKREANFKGN